MCKLMRLCPPTHTHIFTFLELVAPGLGPRPLPPHSQLRPLDRAYEVRLRPLTSELDSLDSAGTREEIQKTRLPLWPDPLGPALGESDLFA